MKCIVTFLTTIAVVIAESPEKPNAFPKFPDDVHVVRGVAFLAAGRSEKADIYSPINKSSSRQLAAVLHIHGGGFTGGKRDAEREINICSNLHPWVPRHEHRLQAFIQWKSLVASKPLRLQNCRALVAN